MKLGVIGLGVIGSATKQGFEHIGHTVFGHDIKLETSIDDVLDTEVCFICVPTNSLEDGSCDTGIVDSVVSQLVENYYKGIIAIKSTVLPGTTLSLSKKYDTNSIVFVPEFLRERCAYEDFIYNQDICVIGAQTDVQYEIIKEIHGNLPQKFEKATPTEAELVKYFNNVYNASLITFANSFGTLCESLKIDYTRVKNIAVQRKHINDIYLDFNDKTKGFGGVCLPKDTKAINYLANQIAPHITFFNDILIQNSKFEITVFKNMRK
jgi:nucleotide sugar dehydrogenase